MKKLPLLLLTLLAVLALSQCANPGSGPDGGPYDETPPRLVSTSPKLGATDNQSKRITLVFDEYIKMENANEKVIVSPPQINAPDVRASGKSITVTLNDTLKPNTTYTPRLTTHSLISTSSSRRNRTREPSTALMSSSIMAFISFGSRALTASVLK